MCRLTGSLSSGLLSILIASQFPSQFPSMGLELGNRAAMDAGTQHHERKGVSERIAGGSIGIGRVLAVLSAVVVLLLWMLSR